MLRKTFILLWLLAPVGILFYHYGTWGRTLHNKQIISEYLENIEDQKGRQEWQLVVLSYDKLIANAAKMQEKIDKRNKKKTSSEVSLNVVTESKKLNWRLQLERSRALLNTTKLAEATSALEDQLAEMNEANQKGVLISEVRNSLAICEYYCGWYMRIEGQSRESWILETETSRQLFRMLAEQALKDGDTEKATELQKNLEAVIRLERMSLDQLFALPIPKKGAGLGSTQVGNKRAKKKAKGKKASNNKGKKNGQGRKKSKKKNAKPKDSSNKFKPGEGS